MTGFSRCDRRELARVCIAIAFLGVKSSFGPWASPLKYAFADEPLQLLISKHIVQPIYSLGSVSFPSRAFHWGGSSGFGHRTCLSLLPCQNRTGIADRMPMASRKRHGASPLLDASPIPSAHQYKKQGCALGHSSWRPGGHTVFGHYLFGLFMF